MAGRGKRFQNTTPIAPVTTHRRRPSRAAQVGADVAVPLFQSMIVSGMLTVIVSILIDVRAGILTGAVVFSAFFLVLITLNRSFLWEIEERLSVDIDQDGVQGRPADDPGFIVINGEKVRRKAAKSAAEQKREAVEKFVEIVWARQQHGRRHGQKELRERSLGHGYQVDDKFHREIGEKLVAAGLAERKYRGWVLTASPDNVAQAIDVW